MEEWALEQTIALTSDLDRAGQAQALVDYGFAEDLDEAHAILQARAA